MSLDKSLKSHGSLVRARSVLTRAERIQKLLADNRWTEQDGPLGLPKVRVARAVIKKAKKKEAATDTETEQKTEKT